MLDHTDSHPGGYEKLHGMDDSTSPFAVAIQLMVAIYDPFGFWRALYRR